MSLFHRYLSIYSCVLYTHINIYKKEKKAKNFFRVMRKAQGEEGTVRCVQGVVSQASN